MVRKVRTSERREEKEPGGSKRNERVVWGWEWRRWRVERSGARGSGWLPVVGHDADENAQPVDQYTPPRRSSRRVRLAPPHGGSRRRSLGHAGFDLSRSPSSAARKPRSASPRETSCDAAADSPLRILFALPLSPLPGRTAFFNGDIVIIKLFLFFFILFAIPLSRLSFSLPVAFSKGDVFLLPLVSENSSRRFFTEDKKIREKDAGGRETI